MPERVAVAPIDGDSVPTPEVTAVPDSAVDRLGDADPTLAVTPLPARDADASPPAESGIQTNKSSGQNSRQGLACSSPISDAERATPKPKTIGVSPTNEDPGTSAKSAPTVVLMFVVVKASDALLNVPVLASAPSW